MPTEFFNYGLKKDVESKVRDGMFSGGFQYTTKQYYDPFQASVEIGVDAKNIEVVLKFSDDGMFRRGPDVGTTPTRGFRGGASQFSHAGRPKPLAQRDIGETNWISLRDA